MRKVEGAVGDLLRGVLLLLAVVAGAQLLRLDVRSLGLAWLAAQRGERVCLLLLGCLRLLRGCLLLRRRLWGLRGLRRLLRRRGRRLLLRHPHVARGRRGGCGAADAVTASVGDLAVVAGTPGWPLGGKYWSNSLTSKVSMLEMTSLLSSPMSTSRKSMGGCLPPSARGRPSRFRSTLPACTSVLGVVGGVGGP